MGQLRSKLLETIGEYLDLDLGEVDMQRRIYDVFLESLRDSPDRENLPSSNDGLRPTDYITLGVSMALEAALNIQLDGEWWSGVLQFGSFANLESRLREEMEDVVSRSARSIAE